MPAWRMGVRQEQTVMPARPRVSQPADSKCAVKATDRTLPLHLVIQNGLASLCWEDLRISQRQAPKLCEKV